MKGSYVESQFSSTLIRLTDSRRGIANDLLISSEICPKSIVTVVLGMFFSAFLDITTHGFLRICLNCLFFKDWGIYFARKWLPKAGKVCPRG